jgi:cell division protein FtsW
MSNAATTTSIHVPTQSDHGQRTAAMITVLVAALAALGIVLVYSSTSVGIAMKAQDATLFLRRQLLWVALGAGVFALARTADLKTLRRWAWPLIGLTIVCLILVLVPGIGKKINGAKRWIRLGSFNGQPSELAKIALVVFCAAWASGRREQLGRLRGSLPALGVIGLTAGLVAVEPDMGTALLLSSVATTVLLVGGVPLRHLLMIGGPGAAALLLFAASKLTYITHRIQAFMDPASDPGGVSYQTRQAVIAIGSGGPFGVGLGASQQKLLFLPDVHTDFIFALVGEELGFVGAVAVLLVFAALIVQGIKAVDRARDDFSFLLALGLLLTLGVQSVLNVAVATASVPPKGIALPFLSFGGSSLLFACAAAGLIAKVAAEGRAPAPVPVEVPETWSE